MPRNRSEKEVPPSRTLFEGTKIWLDSHGYMHRDNGPAYVRPDGYKSWYQHGNRHRKDGPAVEWPSGRCEWYLNGSFIRQEDPDDAP